MVAAAGAPMEERDRLEVRAGYGVVGDRYALGTGHWSYERRYVSEITFIEREALARVAAAIGRAFVAAESRRNVVTANLRLQELIGKRFAIGDAVFEGERSCDPCGYLDRLLGKPVREQLGVDGGLRARIIVSGTIARGDAVVSVDKIATPH